MDTSNFRQQIRQLIAKDDLDAALSKLQNFLSNSPKLDEIILQSARFNDIRKQIRLGITSSEEANLSKNQIRAGLLELLRLIETQDAPSETNKADATAPKENKTTHQTAEKIYNIENIDKADFS